MASNVDYITELYQKVWGREPDSAGLAFWIGEMNKGTTSGEIFEHFLFHEYFKNEYMPIANLYKMLLDKNPDIEGLNYWVSELDKSLSLKDVARIILETDAYQDAYGNTNDQNFVEKLYQEALGRTPDTEGLAYWITELENGMSRSDLATLFAELSQTTDYLLNDVQKDIVYQTLLGRHMTSQELGIYYSTNLETLITQTLVNEVVTITLPEDITVADRLTVSFTDEAMILSGVSNGDITIDNTSINSILDNSEVVTLEDDTPRDEINTTQLDVSITVQTSSDGQTVKTGSGDDELTGSTGVDIFYAGAGVDELYGGSGLDLFYIEHLTDASTLAETYDGQADNANLIVLESGTLDLTQTTLANINLLTLDDSGNSLILTHDHLNHIASIVGSAYEDTITFTTAGLIDSSSAQYNNIDEFIGSDSGQNEFIGGAGSHIYQGGNQGDYFLPGLGDDVLNLGTGVDTVRYTSFLESRYTGTTTLDIDTIDGFDFLEDKIKLDYAIDGSATRVTLSNVFITDFEYVLENDAALNAAFASLTNDAVLLTVSSGTAPGQYLLIEDSATPAGFTIEQDMLIKLTGAVNTLHFGTSDFIS